MEAADSVTTMLILSLISYAFHHESATSEIPVVSKALQNPSICWLTFAARSLLSIWVASSRSMFHWIVRRCAGLSRVDYRLRKIRKMFFTGVYTVVFRLTMEIIKIISIKCLTLGIHGFICLICAFKICRLLFPDMVSALSWQSCGVTVLCLLMSKVLKILWIFRTLYLREEEFEARHKYHYSPLGKPDQIRLLLVHPWTWGSAVRYSMVRTSLSSSPIYEAISYAWGNSGETEEIIVDGCYLEVPKNAYRAITAISSIFLPRVIWIDSICINQSDTAEKPKQVMLMRRIYREAYEVTVWLGSYSHPEQGGEGSLREVLGRYTLNKDLDDETLLRFDAHMALEILHDLYFVQHLDENSKRREAMSILAQTRSRYASYSRRALLKFIHHPWFERIWVIQEVALAKHVRVLYGGEEIMWQTVVQAFGILFHEVRVETAFLIDSTGQAGRTKTLPFSLINILKMEKIREGVMKNTNLTFSEVLTHCLYFKATDPRDLIFGIRGLPHSLPNRLMEPDYTVSALTVYINAAESLCIEKEFNHVFGYAGVGNVEKTSFSVRGLPSWVPDWTTPPQTIPLSLCYANNSYGAGAGKPTNIKLEPKECLSMSAIIFDTIDELGPLIIPQTNGEGSAAGVAQKTFLAYEESWLLVSQSCRTRDPYPFTLSNPSLREVFWRSLIGDRTETAHPAPPEFGDMFERMMEEYKTFPDSDDDPLFRGEERMKKYQRVLAIAPFDELMKGCAMGRRICTTSKGYVGFCPSYSVYRDIICVVPGLQVPLLLRPVTTSKNAKSTPKYRLVGECYVHGIMNGEALLGEISLSKFLIV